MLDETINTTQVTGIFLADRMLETIYPQTLHLTDETKRRQMSVQGHLARQWKLLEDPLSQLLSWITYVATMICLELNKGGAFIRLTTVILKACRKL
jgi:hypothetical protein